MTELVTNPEIQNIIEQKEEDKRNDYILKHIVFFEMSKNPDLIHLINLCDYSSPIIPMLLSKLKKSIPKWEDKMIKVFGEFIYNPTLPYGFDNKQMYFNRYKEPEAFAMWRRLEEPCLKTILDKDILFSHIHLSSSFRIPTIVHDFLKHFTDGKKNSYEYLIRWMAFSIDRESYMPFLVGYGPEGNGKGTLFDLIASIHGLDNSRQVRDSVLKGNFNAALENITFLNIDEVAIGGDKEALNRLKDLINKSVEIERKYENSKRVQNWAKVYISSNDEDALNVTDSQRRFSIVELTDKPLYNSSMLKTKYQNDTTLFKTQLLDKKTINMFTCYLLNVLYYYKNFTSYTGIEVYKCKNYSDIVNSNLKTWGEYLVEVWYEDKIKQINIFGDKNYIDIPMLGVQNAIRESGYSYNIPGKAALKSFCHVKSDTFKFITVKGRHFVRIFREKGGV